ncbi:MAG: Omp28-related outer membrane protein [Flavobacteriales bacterium]|nr:Omp28-related outer membrane protein [Flavobacteriales bacterium]
MKKLLGTLAIASLLVASCDQIDDPVVPVTTNYRADLYGDAPTFGAAPTTGVNVFIEDFTAHQCGNCPNAAVIADEIYEDHPDRVVLLAIHAGNLAVTNAEDPYSTDWVTDEGQFFWDQLDFQANPLGRINRSGGPGNFFSPPQWEDQVGSYLSNDAAVNLQMSANYVAENNHLNLHVNGQWASDYENPTNLIILFSESELYDWQLWYGNEPESVPDYHFKHTLRGSVTGPTGLSFSSGSNSGDEDQNDYTFEWNMDWIMENCEAIALVVDNVTGEVVNVTSLHL